MAQRRSTFLVVATMVVACCGRRGDVEISAAKAARPVEGRPLRVVVRAVRYDMPVAGARIKRHDDGVELGRTDATGGATILVGDPEMVVDVEAPIYATLVFALSYFSRQDDGSLLVILDDGIPVRGRVLDAATRAPVEHARIEAGSGLGSRSRYGTAMSDEEGRFEITGVPLRLPKFSMSVGEPTIECRVAAAGHVTGSFDCAPAAGDHLIDAGDVLLEPAAIVRVRVVRADGGPAEGARVRFGDADFEPAEAREIPFPFAEPPTEKFTDATGEAVLDRMPHEARVSLVASTDEYAEMGGFIGVAVPRGAKEGRADVRLEPRGRLVVHVRDADGTEIPAADTRVWIEPVDSIGAGRSVDGDPHVVRGLRPGKWRVHAERKHGATGEAVFDVAVGLNEAEMRLGGRATLTGRVVDDLGKPRNHTLIEVRRVDGGEWQAAANVDDSGSFRIDRLVEGAYVVRAASQDLGVAWLDVNVPGREVLVVVERLSHASGRLHASDGLELPSRTYVQDVTGDTKARHAENEPCDIAAGVLHTYVAAQGRRVLKIECDGFEDALVTVDMVAGEERSFGDVTLVSLPSIAGRVVDESGHAVADATYLIRELPRACGRTDETGNFRFACTTSWRGVVHAFAPGLAGSIDVGNGTPRDELVVGLHRTTPLYVRVEQPADGWSRVREVQIVRRRDGEVFFVGGLDARGRVRIDVLPGAWIVRAVGEDYKSLAEARVEVRGTATEPGEVVLAVH